MVDGLLSRAKKQCGRLAVGPLPVHCTVAQVRVFQRACVPDKVNLCLGIVGVGGEALVDLKKSLFLDTWLGTYPLTMSQDVTDVQAEQADFPCNKEVVWPLGFLRGRPPPQPLKNSFQIVGRHNHTSFQVTDSCERDMCVFCLSPLCFGKGCVVIELSELSETEWEKILLPSVHSF